MPRQTRRTLAFLLLAAFAATLPLYGIVRPHRGGDARKQVLDMEQQWRQAQLNDDIPAMEKLLSDNYIGITISGQVVTKAQQLDRMRRRQVVVTRFEATDTSIKFLAHGRVAIVNALAQVEGTSDTRAINGSFRYTRVYQRMPSGSWKITNFEATRVPANVSGSSAQPAGTNAPPPAPSGTTPR